MDRQPSATMIGFFNYDTQGTEMGSQLSFYIALRPEAEYNFAPFTC